MGVGFSIGGLGGGAAVAAAGIGAAQGQLQAVAMTRLDAAGGNDPAEKPKQAVTDIGSLLDITV